MNKLFISLVCRNVFAIATVGLLVASRGKSSAAENSTPDPALPKVSPDWKVEVVIEPPVLEHPSVVAVAPDGRVFVAQDPMDMRGPSNGSSDSILCLHPDGKVTLFATNLHAVYGLAYVDGKVFVHHTPQFSVFTDDNGISKDRVDLFSTNPNPSDGGYGFNDHIPSNMRLGMDGWFYMSTGDKGIYGAVGQDGSKVSLEGGGLMRFRPDGTQLEIVATGTRNHLDVAINAEDERFTYDNTDDGLGWWTRATHIVDGGFYGYPYDYLPQRPYTLWRMTEYGGGSPTGAIAYNEDALPEEYRGNLFLCEWGRQQLLRLKVVRDGGSYRVDSRAQSGGQDFVVRGSKDFRPVGIAVSPDGMSFYIADWAFGGWKQRTVTGRLLKLTYTGKSLAAPKPSWWVAAGTGKPFRATSEELATGLKHPAQSVRMVAQRRLAERGQEVAPLLQALLADGTTPAPARWHAIWTLDAIDGGAGGRKTILAAAVRDTDASVRAQAIRQLGTRQAKESVSVLTPLLKDSEPIVRFQAATALGRIGDPAAVEALTAALDEKDLFIRYSAFTALNRIGRIVPSAWTRIAAGLLNPNTLVREGTLFAMRETFVEQNAQALAAFVASAAPNEPRADALAVLAALHRQRPEWNGRWWYTQPAKGSPRPKNVEWTGTPLVVASIRSALADADVIVRRAAVESVAVALMTNATPQLREMFDRESNVEMKRTLLRSLGNLKDEASGPLVAAILSEPQKNEALLSDAVSAAGRINSGPAIEALIRLADVSTDAQTLGTVLPALGNTHSAQAAPAAVKLLRHTEPKIRSQAGEALAAIGGPAALNALTPLLDDPDATTQKAAINAAGLLKNRQLVPKLVALYKIDATRADSLNALTRIPDLQALDVYLEGLRSGDNSVRDNSRRAIESFRDRALPQIEARHRETPFTGRPLTELQRVYAQNDRAKQGPLFVGNTRPAAVEEYAKYTERNSGNAARGQKIFETQANCATCHRIKGKGGEVGPDLTGIATKYAKAALIESVLYPSKQIFDGYKATIISLKDGDSITGFIRDEKPEGLTLLDPVGQKHVFTKDQIAKRQESDLSLMPEGLHAAMSLSEFSDLVAYLEAQKE